MLTFVLLLAMAVAAFAQERLYVVQSSDESLAEIRLDNDAVNPRVLDLGYGCNDIAVNGNRLYVTNSLLNTVQEIDAESNSTLREIPTTGGVNPYAVVALNAETLAVTCWVSNNLLLIRVSDGAVVGDIPVGVAPQGMLVHEDRLFVCLTRYLSPGSFGPGAVMVYDRRSLALMDSIQTGVNPQTCLVDDTGRLHIVCTGDYGAAPGQIDVATLTTLEVNTTLPVGGTPTTISFGGGYAFVAAGGWGEDGLVYRYRLSDLSVLNDADNPLTTAPGATDVEAREDGTFLVSCFMADVVEQRSAEGELIHSYPLSDGPGQMVLYPTAMGVEPGPDPIPGQHRLIEAYPNPFNSQVQLVLRNAPAVASQVIIYNALGQVIETLPVGPGTGEMTWSPRGGVGIHIGTGVYYAVWDGGGEKARVKLLYLK